MLMRLCICLEICLSSRFMSIVYGLGWLTLCHCYLKIHVAERPGASLWVLRHFLLLISSLLVCINFLLKTSRGVLFLPSSDVYVRSFLYLFYTLINVITQKFWAIKPHFWPLIEFFSSGGQETWRLSWFSNNFSDLIKKYSWIDVQYTRIYQLNKILIFKVLKIISKNIVLVYMV